MLDRLPQAVKTLLIVNIAFFILTEIGSNFNIDLYPIFAMYFPKSESFYFHQIITHMFMHGGVSHILFNMFNLVMFGVILERLWGTQKFVFFYFSCGLGAVILHTLVGYFHYSEFANQITPENLKEVIENGYNIMSQGKNYANAPMGDLNILLNTPVLGASGAVIGIMLAFALLFPNTELYLMFIPVPVKAKYLIGALVAYDLFSGFADFQGDNVAHFAHLGGALVAFILIKLWKNK